MRKKIKFGGEFMEKFKKIAAKELKKTRQAAEKRLRRKMLSTKAIGHHCDFLICNQIFKIKTLVV